jgi:hypothetical protein
MESMGEEYPAEVFQDYEHRMPVSAALKYLREAIGEIVHQPGITLTTGS